MLVYKGPELGRQRGALVYGLISSFRSEYGMNTIANYNTEALSAVKLILSGTQCNLIYYDHALYE